MKTAFSYFAISPTYLDERRSYGHEPNFDIIGYLIAFALLE